MGKPLNHSDFTLIPCQVTEIDVERQRFLVSLKMSDCCPDQNTEASAEPGVELLESYLSERRHIIQQLASSSGKTSGEVQYHLL